MPIMIIPLNATATDEFMVHDSDGVPVTGLVDGNFTRDLYNPAGSEVSGSITVTIAELGNGKYRATWTPNAEGNWVLTIYHATYFPGGKVANYLCVAGGVLKLTDILSDSTAFAGANIDASISSVVDRIDELILAAETVAATGSSTTEIRTGLTQADDFFNNMVVVVVNSAGVAARNVNDYAQTNGAITVDALPFTPAVSDPVFILARTGSVPVDVPSIVAGVWSEALPGSYGAGEAGKIIGDNIDASIASVLSAIAALNDLSQADVQTAMTAQGYTSVRAALLDNLDASISSVASAIAALNDLSQADVQAAMTSQGYTTARAALLDYLDVTLSAVKTSADLAKALVHDNTVVDNQSWYTYAGVRFLEGARIRAYDTKANAIAAGATGLLYTFTLYAEYTDGDQTLFRIVREP